MERASSIASLHAAYIAVGAADRALLKSILAVEADQVWAADGARDLAHWLAMQLGISEWRCRRMIAAAHALESLPQIASALSRGDLSLDKTLELARFAAPSTEADLVGWARGVSVAAVRRKADRSLRPDEGVEAGAEHERSVTWWHTDDGAALWLEAKLPAASGATVVRAIERAAKKISPMPGEEHLTADRRRADALVAICGSSLAADEDPDRATVVVHAELDTLVSGNGRAQTEDGALIGPAALSRLLCNARVQVVGRDERGQIGAVSAFRRQAPDWLVREVRYRDDGCTFPGCGAQAFTEAHHIRFWSKGGATTAENLTLICSFHHRVVHEWGWSLQRLADGTLEWRRPDGRRHPPPREAAVEIAA